MKKWIPVFAALALSACGDECREYSDYSCSQLERQTYNVYFWFPDGNQDYFLGQSTGLRECGNIAYGYASSKSLIGEDWSYICCLQTDESSCAEKHR